MPTVFRSGPYRLFFYSGEAEEPPHVHIERDDCVAKYWLNPVRLANRFSRAELREIGKLIAENRRTLLDRWDEHFGN